MPEDPNNPPELTIETVIETPIEELNDDQKTFLIENQDKLSDEQKGVFKDILEEKEEEEPPIDEPSGRTIPKKEDDEPPTDDEEIDPDDEKTIGKVVDRKIKPLAKLTEEIQAVKDRQEVDALINAKPEYGKFREAILKYASHPSYKDVPIHFIAAGLAAKDLQKMGAEKEREAQKKAKETQGGGQPFRKPGGEQVDWSTVSKEAFEAQRAKVLGQQG